MDNKIELEIECSACGATGLYVGLGEKDGAAVVCSRCNGTGAVRLSVTKFQRRRVREGVKQVYQHNPGVLLDSTLGGIPYVRWVEGAAFPCGSEVRNVCPAWWAQTVLSKNIDSQAYGCTVRLGESFSQCEHYGEKQKCWARWDEEAKE